MPTVTKRECKLHGNSGCEMCKAQNLEFGDVEYEDPDPAPADVADLAQKIHLAPEPPPFCHSCFGRPEDARYVDFGAVHEGPSFASGFEDEVVVGGNPSISDELVLCEECLKVAAGLVELGDVEALTSELAEQHQRFDDLSDRAAALQAENDQLKKALTAGQEVEAKMPKPAKRKAS